MIESLILLIKLLSVDDYMFHLYINSYPFGTFPAHLQL